jgi:hypothetical protein
MGGAGRILRGLGVAFLVLAATAVPLTSTASATYRSPTKTVSVIGTTTSALVFKTKFGTFECSSAELSGLRVGEEEIEGEWTSERLTLHPGFTGCRILGFNASVKTEGCDFSFTTATTTPGTGSHAAMHLDCASGKAIHVVGAGGLCSIDFGGQENIGLVDFMNEGSGETSSVIMSLSHVENFSYEGVGGFCSGAGTGGTVSGTVSITGTSGGEPVGFKVLMGP